MAPEASVVELNSLIEEKKLRDRGGQLVTNPLAGGLVRADGKFLYPIQGEIPILLVERAIPLS